MDKKVMMMASFNSFNSLVVKLNKEYYQGKCDTYYLKNLNSLQMITLKADKIKDKLSEVEYHFENINLDIFSEYVIVCKYGMKANVQLVMLLEDTLFDDYFSYNKKDLGVTYYYNRSIFKLWAPTALEVLVKVFYDDGYKIYDLKRDEDYPGVYRTEIKGDLDGLAYLYLVRHNTSFEECVDPYSFSSLKNGKASVIINQEKLYYDFKHDCLPRFTNKNQAIIYEASVRDFTKDPKIKLKYPGKFLGMIEEGLRTPDGNLAGIDYLVDLGITHLQLLPIFDFATVDEDNVDLMYNWGYDPEQYGIPEGSYVVGDDPYQRIKQCQKMVAYLHSKKIRVVMDVVYNHVYDTVGYSYEKIVPGYFLRRDANGNLSNGSWCGNDLNTQRSMVRRFIGDMCIRWQLLYGIDGYRFDLMGIIDIDTINHIYYICNRYDSSFIVYGEGWNMPTALPDNQKSCQENYAVLNHISFFNDQFRDILKNYLSDKPTDLKQVCDLLIGNKRYLDSSQSISYVECHDNATVYDFLKNTNQNEVEETRKKRQLMMTIVVLLSQGIPFIHAGQEFYRTKKGVENSYNSDDSINMIDWSLLDKNKYDVDRIKKIIKLRKENPGFWYSKPADLQSNISTSILENRVIKYKIKQISKYHQIEVFINPTYVSYNLNYDQSWTLLYSDGNQDLKEVKPISIMIVGK